jgi:hypothetical protein
LFINLQFYAQTGAWEDKEKRWAWDQECCIIPKTGMALSQAVNHLGVKG